MNTTTDKPAEPLPLSEFAAHIKRTMTADELYAMLTNQYERRVSGEEILKMVDDILAKAEGPQGD